MSSQSNKTKFFTFSDIHDVFTTTLIYNYTLTAFFTIFRQCLKLKFVRCVVKAVVLAIYGHKKSINVLPEKHSKGKKIQKLLLHEAMSTTKPALGERMSIQRDAVFLLLKQLAFENESFFRVTPSSSVYSNRLAESCHEIGIAMDVLPDLVKQIHIVSQKCDYDAETPGNGFRSLICVSDMAVLQLISILRNCTETRNSIMFRISHNCKEVEGFCAVIRFLVLAFQQVIADLDCFAPGALFPSLDGDYERYNSILRGIESLDTSCFYARPLGFQFSPSVTRLFRLIGFVLATYSLSWEKGLGPIISLLNTSRYLISPEQRAEQIVKAIRESDIEFCKGFWNLSELGSMTKFFSPTLALCESREFRLIGPIPIVTKSGESILIPPPASHTTSRPIPYRILSAVHRVGLSPTNASDRRPLSKYLVVHCHGGGYVATSSKSHETYLRAWAKDLNCPLLSIDYSLAPENPFPRATEEVLYAYCYIINNPHEFGWTGDRIVLVGDSAGGNLVTSVSLRLIQIGVERMPNGLVLMYTPFLFQYLPSPSRVLSFMDPLLHMGVVIRCAAAYTGATVDEKPRKQNGTQPANGNGHKSLVEYVDEVQRAQPSALFDFANGPQGIVSLINLAALRRMTPPPEEDKEVQPLQTESFIDASPDEIADNVELDSTIRSVQVSNDPENIYFSSTDYDVHFLDYLQIHPLTKDKVFYDASESLNDDGLDDVFNGDNDKNADCGDGINGRRLSTRRSLKSLSHPKTPLRDKRRSLGQSLAYGATIAANHISEWFVAPGPPIGFGDKQKLNRAVTLTPAVAARVHQEEVIQTESAFSALLKLQLPREPLISPMYAPDELVRHLPPVYFIGCHLDPLLDDTIMFAKKLRDAGGTVKRLDLLNSIPHGFLNFTMMSNDCREGSNLCLCRIREALGMGVHNHN